MLADIRMPPTHTDEGIRAAERFRRTHPQLGVVVLSQHADAEGALALVAGGSTGRGYLLKERVADVEQLVSALEAVRRGESVIDPHVVDALMRHRLRFEASPVARLTSREREVLGLIATGASNSAIASAAARHLPGGREAHQLDLHQARPARRRPHPPAGRGRAALPRRQRRRPGRGGRLGGLTCAGPRAGSPAAPHGSGGGNASWPGCGPTSRVNLVAIWSSVLALVVLRLASRPLAHDRRRPRTRCVACGILLLAAEVLAGRGRTAAAAAVTIVATWVVALAITWVSPFLAPVGLLALLLPLVIVADHLAPRVRTAAIVVHGDPVRRALAIGSRAVARSYEATHPVTLRTVLDRGDLRARCSSACSSRGCATTSSAWASAPRSSRSRAPASRSLPSRRAAPSSATCTTAPSSGSRRSPSTSAGRPGCSTRTHRGPQDRARAAGPARGGDPRAARPGARHLPAAARRARPRRGAAGGGPPHGPALHRRHAGAWAGTRPRSRRPSTSAAPRRSTTPTGTRVARSSRCRPPTTRDPAAGCGSASPTTARVRPGGGALGPRADRHAGPDPGGRRRAADHLRAGSWHHRRGPLPARHAPAALTPDPSEPQNRLLQTTDSLIGPAVVWRRAWWCQHHHEFGWGHTRDGVGPLGHSCPRDRRRGRCTPTRGRVDGSPRGRWVARTACDPPPWELLGLGTEPSPSQVTAC